MFWVAVFCYFVWDLFVLVVGFFPVGISPVNDTVLTHFYKVLASITVQHILFFTSNALSHCSLGLQLDIDKKCKNTYRLFY